jgi:hypothetical protein
MVQPINYMAQIPQVNLAQSLGEGLRLGVGIREMQEKREAAQQAAQMKQQLATDLAAAQANPTQSTWANMITKYPQFREAFGDASKMYGQERVDNEFFAGAEVSNALEKGNVDAASARLDTIIEARKNSKQPVGVYEQIRESLKSGDIKGAQSGTNFALAVLNPDKFKKIADATGVQATEGFEVITPERVKTLGLPAGNTYQRNTKTGKIESLGATGTTGERFEILTPSSAKTMGLPAGNTYQKDINTGKITAVGGGGVTVNLPPQIGSIPPDYRMTYDGNKPVAMEVIPGSKTARELEAAAGKGQMAAESTLTTAGVVTQDISRLTNAIKKQKLTDPVTGTLGAVVGEQGGVLAAGSARRSAEGLVRTIQANIGFDRLNQMRLESPTGGALGNITEQELKFLQSVLGSIDLNQKDADIIRNLERLYKKDPKTGVESGLYVNIMKKAAAYPNASKFGFGGGAPAGGGTPTPAASPAGGGRGGTPLGGGFVLMPG